MSEAEHYRFHFKLDAEASRYSGPDLAGKSQYLCCRRATTID